MTGGATKRPWGQMLRYAFAAMLCLLLPVAVWGGLQWYWSVGNLCTALIIILGQRRIFRPGVSRRASDIVCRYTPWFEGNAYMAIAVIPLMGAALTATGREPSNPAWLRFAGILLMCVMPLAVFSVLRMWRRCPLCISPTELTLRLATPGSELTEIRREHVVSITPKMVRNPVNGQSLQTEIAYHATDSNRADIETVLLGLHLTVQPINLANALVAWKDGAGEDPSELLDRMEQILRGPSSVNG